LGVTLLRLVKRVALLVPIASSCAFKRGFLGSRGGLYCFFNFTRLGLLKAIGLLTLARNAGAALAANIPMPS
jgi:hypothetical protein